MDNLRQRDRRLEIALRRARQDAGVALGSLCAERNQRDIAERVERKVGGDMLAVREDGNLLLPRQRRDARCRRDRDLEAQPHRVGQCGERILDKIAVNRLGQHRGAVTAALTVRALRRHAERGRPAAHRLHKAGVHAEAFVKLHKIAPVRVVADRGAEDRLAAEAGHRHARIAERAAGHRIARECAEAGLPVRRKCVCVERKFGARAADKQDSSLHCLSHPFVPRASCARNPY